MSTFQVNDRMNDNKGDYSSVDGFILSIPRKPLVEPHSSSPKSHVAIPLQAL